jgi:hypothetical protein
MTRPTVEPFHADTIAHFRRHGFGYMGLRFIATDVVRENNQTYRLTYKELRKDSDQDGLRLARVPAAVLQAADRPLERLCRRAGHQGRGRIQPRALADRRRRAVALVGRPAADGRGAGADAARHAGADVPAWSIQDVYDHEAHVAIGEGWPSARRCPRPSRS